MTDPEYLAPSLRWESSFPGKIPHRSEQILRPINPDIDAPVRVISTFLIAPHGRYIFYTPHLDITYYGLPLAMHESIFYQLYYSEDYPCVPSPTGKSSSKTSSQKPPTFSISRLLKWLFPTP